MWGLLTLILLLVLLSGAITVGFRTALYMFQDGHMKAEDVVALVRETPLEKRSRFYEVMCQAMMFGFMR